MLLYGLTFAYRLISGSNSMRSGKTLVIPTEMFALLYRNRFLVKQQSNCRYRAKINMK